MKQGPAQCSGRAEGVFFGKGDPPGCPVGREEWAGAGMQLSKRKILLRTPR